MLSLARQQEEVRLDQTGYLVAKGIEQQLIQPFIKPSMELRDGPNGEAGALGILRSFSDTGNEITVVCKYGAHGMGHGHFDKLSYFIYDNDTEVIQDYGSARWVNIDQKAGGRYLKENSTWAKQSIAHNTLVIDQQSHFEGKYDLASTKHSDPWYFNAENKQLQIMSARENNAYPGTEMQRTLLLWKDSSFVKPLVIDLFMAHAQKTHTYDLPLHFAEHVMHTNFPYTAPDLPYVMGEAQGYEHVYVEARADTLPENIKFNWFRDGKFFTMTSLSIEQDAILFARIGANDPEFNLRRDAFLVHRKKETMDPLYLSVIESHGTYSPVNEIPVGPYSKVHEIKLIYHTKDHTLFSIESVDGIIWEFMLAHSSNQDGQLHALEIGEKSYKWAGPFSVQRVEGIMKIAE